MLKWLLVAIVTALLAPATAGAGCVFLCPPDFWGWVQRLTEKDTRYAQAHRSAAMLANHRRPDHSAPSGGPEPETTVEATTMMNTYPVISTRIAPRRPKNRPGWTPPYGMGNPKTSPGVSR